MIDCGMAYSAGETISNIKEILNGRSLDYILISHTHYDHIGALPYIKKEFPDAVVQACVKDQLDRNGDGYLSDDELERVYQIGRAVAQERIDEIRMFLRK